MNKTLNGVRHFSTLGVLMVLLACGGGGGGGGGGSGTTTAPNPVTNEPEPIVPEPVVPEPVTPEPVIPAPVIPEPTIPVPTGWKLAWNDEFEGNALNTNIWNYDIGNNATSGWGNNELQYYRPQNAAVANGVLSITAQRSTSNELGSVENKAYTSARLHTARKKTFTYGRFEMRAKLPQGQGMWPAFWMLGASCTGFSGSYGGTINWPDCGEIDVMEMVGGNDIANPARGDFTTHGTLHYRNAQGVNPMLSGSKRHTERLSQNFNTYTLDWSATEFVWYFNGVEFARRSVANDMQAFVNKPYFLLLNLAVGGNWPGAPDSATVFPQKFEIDYIRVYQKL